MLQEIIRNLLQVQKMVYKVDGVKFGAFNDEISMNAVKELLRGKDIIDIEFVSKPIK